MFCIYSPGTSVNVYIVLVLYIIQLLGISSMTLLIFVQSIYYRVCREQFKNIYKKFEYSFTTL
jgi:hypothetical protein